MDAKAVDDLWRNGAADLATAITDLAPTAPDLAKLPDLATPPPYDLAAPPTISYSTDFSITENPLSDGGRWLHSDGTLTVCRTGNGKAFGTQTGTGNYDDSNAYMTGFGNNHEVEGVVWLSPTASTSGYREVEVLLRWSDTGPLRQTDYGPTHANGYEINWSYLGQYLILGRFKGAELTRAASTPVPKSGDKFRARIEGQHIRVWVNDVLQIDFTDNDPTLEIQSGNPGIGFFIGGAGVPATDFSFDSVTLRAL
jgi:hypothetical protein